MTIIDYIQRAGDKLVWQKLADCYTKLNTTKKGFGDTTISFKTKITTDQFMKGEYIGIVIWLPRDSIK